MCASPIFGQGSPSGSRRRHKEVNASAAADAEDATSTWAADPALGRAGTAGDGEHAVTVIIAGADAHAAHAVEAQTSAGPEASAGDHLGDDVIWRSKRHCVEGAASASFLQAGFRIECWGVHWYLPFPAPEPAKD